MQVAPGSVVSFHYTLSSLDGGAVLDSSHGKSPFTYLHGYQPLNIANLEEQLAGHEAGEEIVLMLPPEQFGKYDPQKIQEIPREAFPPTSTLTPGARYTTMTSDGKELSFGVVDVQSAAVVVDFNHPLAGQEALLSVKVEEVRQGTQEECAQGRPLGVTS